MELATRKSIEILHAQNLQFILDIEDLQERVIELERAVMQ